MSGERRRRTGRVLAVVGISTVLAAGATAAVSFGFRAAPAAPAQEGTPGATAGVTVRTMAETTVVDGELGYGPAEPVEAKAGGTLTWLPPVGAVLAQGDTLLRADEKPVVLLYGTLPMYRPLALDTTGTDVKQFETDLRALGYTGFTVDETYSQATVDAVRRWQKHLHVEETGVVDVTAVVYVPAAIRVATWSARVGAAAQGQVLTYTAETKVVTMNVPARNSAWAAAGTPVTVELPNGAAVAGAVSSVGTEAVVPPDQGDTPGDNTANATVAVVVSVPDQTALGRLDRGPVQVRHVTREHRDVFTVPVVALLAPIEGGYAVEVVTGTRSRIVPVETGLFADGLVELRGTGIAAGMRVRVPS
jgi:peptidoglycan hydrolase-like protein with peptidoglycan-binding domain